MRNLIAIFVFCSVYIVAQTSNSESPSTQPTPPPIKQDAGKIKAYRFPSDYAFFSAERTQLPIYPAEAITESLDGQVILLVQYSTEGIVEAVQGIKGNPILLTSSIQAVRGWKFQPVRIHGQKGLGVTYVAFRFRASSGTSPTVTNVFPYGSLAASPDQENNGASEASDTNTPPSRRVRLSSGVVAGQKISGPNPIYPQGARTKHVQGTVLLQGVIAKEGNISSLEIVQSPALDLSAAAIQAVRDWKYRPYTLQGEPVEVETTIQVNFTLR